jgi:hypothetical protein
VVVDPGDLAFLSTRHPGGVQDRRARILAPLRGAGRRGGWQVPGVYDHRLAILDPFGIGALVTHRDYRNEKEISNYPPPIISRLLFLQMTVGACLASAIQRKPTIKPPIRRRRPLLPLDTRG